MSAAPVKFRPDECFYAFTVTRPVSILMVVLAVVVFGWVSYERLALTLMPNMSYPTLTVRTSYPGTAPEEIENVISRPLEQQLGIIPKLVSLSSISKAGQSDVILEFQWKTDMNGVAQDVREKIDRLRLPDGAQRPLLLHYDPTLDPIMRVGLAGPQSLYALRFLAENEIKRKLEAISGVAAIQVKGGLEEQFLVALDEGKLASLKLDITQIGQRLQAGNLNAPGGNLREGQTEYLIRTLNEFQTLEEIGSFIVARQNGVDIRLRDIASVTRFHKDRDIITRVNGRESVEIEIYKEADANVVAVAAAVRKAIFGTPEQQAYVTKMKTAAAKPVAPKPATAVTAKAETANKSPTAAQLKAAQAAAMADAEKARNAAQELIRRRQMTDFLAYQLPTDASLELLADQSVFISRSIDEVKSNAISGAIIAVIVLYLFLRNVTQTIIIGLSIPISIVATFAPMYMAGVSLNIISLGGLALGVGMLVDNGIVVLESIFRCREEGDDLITGVVRGTKEVGMAVTASTLTTVAVFFPIVFVEGVAGQLFGDMALTVVFSLLASLATALFLIPMLASRKFERSSTPSRALGGSLAPLPRQPGESRVRSGLRQIRTGMATSAWAAAAAGVALAKAVVIIGFVVLAPAGWLGWGAGRICTRRLKDRRPGVLWERLCAWAAADRAWRVKADRVWPGLLAFAAPVRLVQSLSGLGRWLIARRWRWLALLLIPAVLVIGVAVARACTGVPPPRPSYPPGMPKPAGFVAPAWYVVTWAWLATEPWWRLVVTFVPVATSGGVPGNPLRRRGDVAGARHRDPGLGAHDRARGDGVRAAGNGAVRAGDRCESYLV